MGLTLFELSYGDDYWFFDLLKIETNALDRSLLGIFWRKDGGLSSLDLFWIRLNF